MTSTPKRTGPDARAYEWARTIKDSRYFPRGRASVMVVPSAPHDSAAHDRELLESHFGCALDTMGEWVGCHDGRPFTMVDGTDGWVCAR